MKPRTGQALWTIAATVISAALLTSCAARDAGRPISSPGHGAGAPHIVTLSSNGQAWAALTSKVITVRSGHAWRQISSPAAPAAGGSVVVRGKLALVASLADMTLTLAVSHDGGGTWATSRVRLATSATGATIALSPDTKHWVVGPASSPSAGAASQYSYGYINTSKGTLSEVPVPGSMANLAWSGSSLVVPGGPAGSHLYFSDNLGKSWRDVSRAVLGFTPPAANIPATEPVFGPVLGLSGGTAVVPVERTGPKGLTIQLEATTTGTSYKIIGSVHTSGNYAAGPLAVASSSYGPDKAALVIPATMSLYVAAGNAEPALIHMSGLPVSPDSISFQDTANGFAQTTVRSCANAKSHCTVTVSQYVTSDGGHTWTLRRA